MHEGDDPHETREYPSGRIRDGQRRLCRGVGRRGAGRAGRRKRQLVVVRAAVAVRTLASAARRRRLGWKRRGGRAGAGGSASGGTRGGSVGGRTGGPAARRQHRRDLGHRRRAWHRRRDRTGGTTATGGAGGNSDPCGPSNPATVPLPTIPAGSFDITTFGAKGDGKTDNTSAIQMALNAAEHRGRRNGDDSVRHLPERADHHPQQHAPRLRVGLRAHDAAASGPTRRRAGLHHHRFQCARHRAQRERHDRRPGPGVVGRVRDRLARCARKRSTWDT